jgi:hypothetical protein
MKEEGKNRLGGKTDLVIEDDGGQVVALKFLKISVESDD